MCYVGNGAHFTLLCVFRSYLVTVLVSIGTVVHARCRSRARRWRTVSRVSCVFCRCLVTASAHSICWSVSYHFDIVARIVVAVGGRRPSRSPLLSSIYDEHAIHYYGLGDSASPEADRKSPVTLDGDVHKTFTATDVLSSHGRRPYHLTHQPCRKKRSPIAQVLIALLRECRKRVRASVHHFQL